MNTDLIKKIILAIFGIALALALLYVFFYVALFFIIVGLIYYIYYKLFKKDKEPTFKTENKSKNIKGVVIDAEYKEKN